MNIQYGSLKRQLHSGVGDLRYLKGEEVTAGTSEIGPIFVESKVWPGKRDIRRRRKHRVDDNRA